MIRTATAFMEKVNQFFVMSAFQRKKLRPLLRIFLWEIYVYKLMETATLLWARETAATEAATVHLPHQKAAVSMNTFMIFLPGRKVVRKSFYPKVIEQFRILVRFLTFLCENIVGKRLRNKCGNEQETIRKEEKTQP